MLNYLSKLEQKELHRQAGEVQNLEQAWSRRAQSMYQEITDKVIETVLEGGSINVPVDIFEYFLVYQMFMVQREAIRGAKRMSRLAGIPKFSSLEDLVKEWSKWRRGKKIPTKQRAIAKKMKTDYVKKIKSVMDKFSDQKSTDEMVEEMQKAGDLSYGKAKVIICTETTRHYNKARISFYDKSSDVTHYLFLPIRDHRTTKWCKTRAGLVYEKGSTYLEKESPPCHWYCRSEVTPLTPLNPEHLKLIKKASIQRSNRHPEPLPKGWNQK
jgi:SPP1 gp7 family putative phage head morphogenesis protein